MNINKRGSLDWWKSDNRESQLKELIKEGVLTRVQIAGKFGFIDPDTISKAIKLLNLEEFNNIPGKNFNRNWSKLAEKKKLKIKESSINHSKCTDLAPLKYTPDIIEFRYGTRNNIHYYVPEIGKMVPKLSLLNTLDRLGIQYCEWICKWYLKMSLDKIGSFEWVECVINKFYSDVPPITQDYIRCQLLKDNNYIFIDYLCKDNIITDAINSWKNSTRFNEFCNFDFSKVPEIIKNMSQTFIIIDKTTGKEYYTTYRKLVIELRNPINISPKRRSTEDFIKLSDNKFGKGSFTCLSEYHGNDREITLRCNKCGNVFKTTPRKHLYSEVGACPTCVIAKFRAERSFDKSKIQEVLDNTYGVGVYECIGDYINAKTPILLREISSGREFMQDPENILYHKVVDPLNQCKSVGEYFTNQWLLNNNIIYRSHVYIDYIEGRSKGTGVEIDFIVSDPKFNREIWIEYNGRQHYDILNSSFGSNEGLIRDENVRSYCERNSDSIKYIEIPYTIHSCKKISEFLYKTIFEDVDPNELIDYKSLFKI